MAAGKKMPPRQKRPQFPECDTIPLPEACRAIGIHRTTGYRRAEAGLDLVAGVPFHDLGAGKRLWRVKRTDLQQFLDGMNRAAS